LSATGDDLIDASRYLLLTCGDAVGDLVGAPRHLLVIGGDFGSDLVDATHYLIVTRGNSVDALLDRVERHCIALSLIERRAGWRGQADHARGVLRS